MSTGHLRDAGGALTELKLKGPRALKRYVAKWRAHLKACHWDDLYALKLQDTCKKWFKRIKKPTEYDLS